MNQKIGLVEDDVTMRSLMETLFKLEGFHPISFPPTSLESVFANIIKESPAALLIDVNLKTFSGITLAKEIRASADLPQPVIVMASGIDLTNECKEAGADHFFLKPYMPQDLTDWLKSQLV